MTETVTTRRTVTDPEGNVRSAFTHSTNRCDTCRDASGRDAHYPGEGLILCARCNQDFYNQAYGLGE